MPASNDYHIPHIHFWTSTDDNSLFDVALYGSNQLINEHRHNLTVETPLAYYLITNASLERYAIPWSTAEIRNLIRDHLRSNGLIYEDDSAIRSLVPEGSLKEIKGPRALMNLNLALPDFFPNCKELEAKLNNAWNNQNNVKATCVDLVDYAQKALIEKSIPWQGLLLPLSSGAPFRNAIFAQYFSKFSPESFIGKATNPENLFYLIGMGKNYVTVDKRTICGITSNSLGISDIKISDFTFCN